MEKMFHGEFREEMKARAGGGAAERFAITGAAQEELLGRIDAVARQALDLYFSGGREYPSLARELGVRPLEGREKTRFGSRRHSLYRLPDYLVSAFPEELGEGPLRRLHWLLREAPEEAAPKGLVPRQEGWLGFFVSEEGKLFLGQCYTYREGASLGLDGRTRLRRVEVVPAESRDAQALVDWSIRRSFEGTIRSFSGYTHQGLYYDDRVYNLSFTLCGGGVSLTVMGRGGEKILPLPYSLELFQGGEISREELEARYGVTFAGGKLFFRGREVEPAAPVPEDRRVFEPERAVSLAYLDWDRPRSREEVQESIRRRYAAMAAQPGFREQERRP